MRTVFSRVSLSLLVGVMIATGCSDKKNEPADIGAWLEAAAGFNVTPEALACTASAAEDLLSEDDQKVWLSHDPETITVEQIQVLPHATEVADTCRHLLGGPTP